MFTTLPDAVLLAIQKLNDAGYEAFVVGGCVRDSLLGNTPLDWDITTSATPAQMQAVFTGFRTVETGLQHGTLTVLIEDMPLEITTYRIDGKYLDGRHPESVLFTHSLAEDLRRRDFTINAMAYHPAVGIVDPYDGQSDLSRRTIRCVGIAEQRFTEDSLRILRALRFASTLGFEIEPYTDSALRALSPTLTRVAIERITGEFRKLLCGCDAHRIVDDYADVLAVILPEIRNIHSTHLLQSLSAKTHVRLSALFYAMDATAETAEDILRRLRMDTHTIHQVRTLLSCKDWPMHSDADLLHLLNRTGESGIADYLRLREADETVLDRVEHLLRENRCYKIAMLQVSGDDLIHAGIVAGPQVGRLLQTLLDAVITGQCENRKTDLLKFIQNIEQPVP